MMKHTVEYKFINLFYRDRVAKRSQVPLINHINEGLTVLSATAYPIINKVTK